MLKSVSKLLNRNPAVGLAVAAAVGYLAAGRIPELVAGLIAAPNPAAGRSTASAGAATARKAPPAADAGDGSDW